MAVVIQSYGSCQTILWQLRFNHLATATRHEGSQMACCRSQSGKKKKDGCLFETSVRLSHKKFCNQFPYLCRDLPSRCALRKLLGKRYVEGPFVEKHFIIILSNRFFAGSGIFVQSLDWYHNSSFLHFDNPLVIVCFPKYNKITGIVFLFPPLILEY